MLTIVKENPDNHNEEILDTNFSVVGIGTKGSEIEILKSIISDLAEDSGMAYLIFETLDYPTTENLRAVLAAQTKLPVIEIVNEINLQPNQIFIIPENNFLIAEDGILKLKPKNRSSLNHNCLDEFYKSIAEIYKSYAIGVLISGTPLDSLTGLKKIKELGGTALSIVYKKGLIQNKNTEDIIDHFVPYFSIASKLNEIQKSYFASRAYEEEDQNSTIEDNQSFNEIIEIIHSVSGTNFPHYRPEILRRRIAKRMAITRKETLADYLAILKNNTSEQTALFNDLLISVSYFFRDPAHFAQLSNRVFPSLIENQNKEKIRIWSAGCATGEEAYSLAITIHQYLEKTQNLQTKVQIFASDRSENSIAKARSGIYTIQDVKNIDEAILEKYFTKKEGSYHIHKTIRDMCVFAVHDLTKDAPFSKIDLIACRNVLLYFDDDLQNQLLNSFHYALRHKGFLFLGRSETAENNPDLFKTIGEEEKIYCRKSDGKLHKKSTFNATKPLLETEVPVLDYEKIAADILQHYYPSAVIVNSELEIVYFHGDTSPFLQPASGKPSFNILNMVSDELAFELKNAIIKSRNKKKNILGTHIAAKKQEFVTSFEVIYLPSYKDLSLIVFSKILSTEEIQNHQFEKPIELINEESILTTNEEQLIDEQLAISKEELQSSNEELSCINDELQDRNRELSLLQNFYESAVNTIREPMLILDKNAIVNSANPSFYKFFKTSPEETEGISIFELGNSHWNILEFKESVLKKLTSQEMVENFKIQFNLEDGTTKTMILNASRISNSTPEEMILIALEDLTDLEKSKEAIKHKNQELIHNKKQLEYFTNAAKNNLLEPVSKIYMFGKKVLDTEKALTEAGRHNLTRLLNSASNLTQLMEDLVEYSQINFTEKKFKMTDLNTLIKKTIYQLKSIIGENQAEIHSDDMPTLSVIPSEINKLFTHLITNSIKYRQKEIVPNIKISTQEPSLEELKATGVNSDSKFIKLIVSDNASGFSKDYEKLIFEPFYRLHGNEKHYGSGLGLTIVSKIVANHNGFIRASSEPSKGTEISIYLPI
ncbi:MAG: PAS domain-containing protein [Flavobacterium sp.]|uniref:CheR family methyltransferase n=1 Tax=Flavobacterium sp. TaxID=239 RepID=UPI001AFFD5C0|nr:CheR family methyltransferase [Flavobacterium sp.]MBO9584853.1 PAS domain-containing protein [Flavobacterium sp.]